MTKHQINCYRIIKGIKYVNWCDILSTEDEIAVKICKTRKIAHRVVKHSDGFQMLFIREDHLDRLK